jgi:glycosyltransferase involved in cell wall biosynthesis/peptidoglycan/xylan/chitin deacetylase (PgdA/CDA1 family)
MSLKVLRDRAANWLGDKSPLRQMSNWVCQSGSSIFLFHRILPAEQACFVPELSTNLSAFSDFLDWLSKNYTVVSLDELVAKQKEKRESKRALCAITFDDGWIDNYIYAVPELARRKLPATIFLPLNFIGTQRHFWQELVTVFLSELEKDPSKVAVLEEIASHSPWFPPFELYRKDYLAMRRLLLSRPSREAQEFSERLVEAAGLWHKLPPRSFVNWNEVEEMSRNGISFGAHTMDHTILTTASPTIAEHEISASRQGLEKRLNSVITGFSYPWGAVGVNCVEQVRASGYQFAVTVRPGVIKEDTDPFLLPRIPISDSILNGGRGTFSAGKARMSITKNILLNTRSAPLGRAHLAAGKKTKIIFVLDLITEWEGGTERQLNLLIRSLDRRYFEPKLCFLFESPELPRETLPCPLIVVGSPQKAHYISERIARLLKLVEILKAERPDIVQSFFVEGVIYGAAAARLAGVPKNIVSVRNAGTWQNRFHRFVLSCVTPLANHWQANSRALWLQEFGKRRTSANKIEILPNGSDLSRFTQLSEAERGMARRSLNLDPNSFVCLSVANLSPIKDISTLLQGARILKGSLPKCHFLIVGEGPLRGTLEQEAAALGLNGSVRFLGRQADVRPYLAASDVGVLTSKSEGSSNSVIEYMAAGLPTVLSDIAPNRELTKGVFFQTGDPKDFAEKIAQLAKNKQLAKDLSTENSRMAEEFSLARFVERAQSYYSNLASEIEYPL